MMHDVTRPEVIRPFVEETVRGFLGVEELMIDPDGTIPIRVGSTAVRVMVTPGIGEDGEPLFRVVAELVRDVAASPELLGALNDLNASLSFARVFWIEGRVLLALELLAGSLDQDQIRHALGLVSYAADRWDTELSARFGGATVFADDGPATQGPSGTIAPSVPPPPPVPAAAPDPDVGPAPKADPGYI
jgi:hypothetical protein